jgi:hypothetical protein
MSKSNKEKHPPLFFKERVFLFLPFPEHKPTGQRFRVWAILHRHGVRALSLKV